MGKQTPIACSSTQTQPTHSSALLSLLPCLKPYFDTFPPFFSLITYSFVTTYHAGDTQWRDNTNHLEGRRLIRAQQMWCVLYHITALPWYLNAQALVLDLRHTVEALQSVSNMCILPPPWVHVICLVIPTVSCNEAAVYLVKVFGGEDVIE
jgi:hypothetical protein